MKMILHTIKTKTKVSFTMFSILLVLAFGFLSTNLSAQSCTQCAPLTSGEDCNYFFTPLITINCAPVGAIITQVDITMSIGGVCPGWYKIDLWTNGAYYGSGCDGTYTFHDWDGQLANDQTFRIRARDTDAWCDDVTLYLCVTVYYTSPSPPTCTDGIMNQDETGIDCGGATCPACPACSDNGPWFHPTTNIAGEYVGSCQVATCSGTYYDDGGAGGNYSNNINNIYRIFCPDQAGMCLTATFSSFSTEAGWDIFTVTNGSTQNSPILWSGSGTGAIGPFTGTINGCLGFRFASDGSVTMPGWAATFSSAPCAGGPNGTDNNDCSTFTQLCDNTPVASNSTGPGISAEGCDGVGCPAGGENYSNWYAVTFTTSGTFTFTIVPTVGTDDYDYALFGPTTDCTNLNAVKIRCSDSYLLGNTGLQNGAGDNTEDVTGDKFTEDVNVLAGEIYFIMVDKWTPTGSGYTLNFGGSATMSCTPIALPVELLSFDANYNVDKKNVDLVWTTASETNNDYFEVQHSADGFNFEKIDVVKGIGNSSSPQSYISIDNNPLVGVMNYYRLKQVDFDGRFKYSDMVAVAIQEAQSQLKVYPNPANETVNISFYSSFDEECRLNIYDYTGNIKLSTNIKSLKGDNKFSIDLSKLPSGVYFITVQGKKGINKSSFIKE